MSGWWMFVAGVFVGANVGLVLAAWLNSVKRQDHNLTAVRALQAVRNENGGLSTKTRDLVNDALLEHEGWGT